MAGRSRSTFGKRQKEAKRQEKRQDKAARKEQRKREGLGGGSSKSEESIAFNEASFGADSPDEGDE